MKLLVFATALCCVLLPTAAPAQTGPEVEPGVAVTSLVSVVEHPAGDKATVAGMHAAKVSANLHTGSNMARGLVYAGQQHTVEVAGVTSALTLTTSKPTFYVRIDPEDPNNLRDEVTLVSLKPTKDSRILLYFSSNTFGGSRKRHVDEVAVNKSDAGSNVLKMTPQAPLAPGEYGIVFLPGDKATYSDRVYDFTVAAK